MTSIAPLEASAWWIRVEYKSTEASVQSNIVTLTNNLSLKQRMQMISNLWYYPEFIRGKCDTEAVLCNTVCVPLVDCWKPDRYSARSDWASWCSICVTFTIGQMSAQCSVANTFIFRNTNKRNASRVPQWPRTLMTTYTYAECFLSWSMTLLWSMKLNVCVYIGAFRLGIMGIRLWPSWIITSI